MVRKILVICHVLLLCNICSAAQIFDSTITLSREEKIRNTFYNYFLVDSFSNVGDSARASEYLMRVDPYYLMFQAYTPENFDKRLEIYRLAALAKEKYRGKFMAVFNEPRSEVYKKFRTMYEEDQDVRNSLDKCGDSLSTAIYARKMIRTDSVHFDYLYKYVQKSGWPKLSDGSLYASLLAWHDIHHIAFYLPYVRKAARGGQISYDTYNAMLNRATNPSVADLAKKFKNKSIFDISYVLKGDTPSIAHLQQMKKAVKNNVPIKYIYFVLEGDKEKDFDHFIKAKGGHSRGIYGWDTTPYWIAHDLMVKLTYYQEELLPTDTHPYHDFAFSQSEMSTKKLTMYLLY